MLVRIAEPDDRLLLERVRGQTNDLEIELYTDASTPLEPTLAEQLDTARALSERQETRAVVWFVREGEALSVLVAEPGQGRVLVRRLERQGGRLGQSAQQEAAALVVRTAMRALAAGGEIGVAEREVAEARPPPAAPAPASTPPTPAPAPASAPRPSESPPPDWDLLQLIGARAAWDGVSDLGQYALSGRLVLQRARIQAELRAALGFPTRLDDAIARVSLVRHGLSLHAAYALVDQRRIVVTLAFGVGASLFITDVDARAALFTAEDASALLVVGALDATLRYMPGWARDRVGIAWSLGAEALPNTLRVGYAGPDGFVERERLWHVLPSTALELVVRLH